MTTWVERYKTNGVWAQLEALGPAIDEALRREGISSEQRDHLDRIRVALTFVGKRLGAADPILMQEAAVNIVGEAVRQAVAHVQSFTSGGDNNQLMNAIVQLDTAMHQCAANVFVPVAAELDGLTNIVALYRLGMSKQLESFIKQAEAHAAELKANEGRLRELQDATAALQQTVSATLTDWQSQFSAAQAGREQQNSTQTATFQEQFSAAQATREQAHAEQQNARQTRFDTLLNEHTTKLQEQAAFFKKEGESMARAQADAVATLWETFIAQGDEVLAAMRTQHAKVDDILGIIGDKTVMGGHKQTADEARSATRLWQGVTVTALVVLIAIASFTIFKGTDLTLGAFAGRVYISVALGVLAAYGASQGDRYHSVERYNRKLALELAALGPFLQPLPEDQREKFRMTVGERTFAQADSEPGKAGSPATAAHVLLKSKEFKTMVEVMKALIEKPK